MTKSFCSLSLLYLLALPVSGQTSLVAREGFEVETWLPGFTSIGAFDVSDTLVYINDRDTIHMMDIRSGEEMERYGLPGDYSSTRYVSFLTVTPDGRSVWTGYTSDGNLDDRIYSLNLASGQWVQRATFPGNMDLVFWHDSILVSGLNSISWDAPASVFVLDTSGTNHHRKIIEVGGYSAGLAIDNDGNLYYGTSYPANPNALYRWDHALIQPVIENPGKVILDTTHGEKLTDLPAGAYDCEVDEGGNVMLNMNLYGGTMVVGMWNGVTGDGQHIDTLATASGEWDWLGILKSRGNMAVPGSDNLLITYSFGQPLAILTRANTVGLPGNLYPQLSLYPNPSSGILRIGNVRADRVDVKVFSLQGALVHSEIDVPVGAGIDISHLPRGSYIVGVTAGQKLTCKVIQKI